MARALLIRDAVTSLEQARRAANKYRPWPSDLRPQAEQLDADTDELIARGPAVATAVEVSTFPSPTWASAAAEADELVDQANARASAWQTLANTLAARAGEKPPFGTTIADLFDQLGTTVKTVVVLVVVAFAALLAVLVWRASRGGATAVIA